MQSEQINELVTALAKAHGKIENATLNKVNPHFRSKYADLAAIFDAVRKPLAEQGIAPMQTIEAREAGPVLVTTLAHSSGQWISSEYPLPVSAKPQEFGSALTYARRYSLSAIAGIAADEDDDANAAQDGKVDAQIAPRKEAPAPAAPSKNPATGDHTPHAIPYSDNPMEWAPVYAASLKTSQVLTDIAEWEHYNKATLKSLETSAPTLWKRIKATRDAMQDKLTAPAEAAE